MHEQTDEDACLAMAQQPHLHTVGCGLRSSYRFDDAETLDRDITALMVQLSWVPARAEDPVRTHHNSL
jgi:hypothetical protein